MNFVILLVTFQGIIVLNGENQQIKGSVFNPDIL